MNADYRIITIDQKEKWIFIHDSCTPYLESDGFINLVKKICSACSGKVRNAGDCQYKIDGDKFDLIYQWDDLFGIVVIYQDNDRLEDIKKYLESFF